MKRSNPHRPCPVCAGAGCGVAGSLVLCWRVQSERQAKSGAWLHGTGPLPYERRFIQRTAPVLASIERRHEVFTALLEGLTLSDRHYEHLTTVRGLDPATIATAQFRTVPDYQTASDLMSVLAAFYELSNVPGLYRKDTDWRLRFAGMPGFYIPLRDAHGRIEALQIRLDGNDSKFRYCLVSTPPDEFPQGASSGAPAHFAGVLTSSHLIITEGGLKAIICAQILMNVCVVGLVAAGTFCDSFGWELRNRLPAASVVGIAFDAPAREASERARANVAQQRERLIKSLERAQYEPDILTWDGAYKGFDDYLLQGQR